MLFDHTFNPILQQPLHDIADDLVYADLEDNNYGPINYKAASIYNMVKFKGRTPNWAAAAPAFTLLRLILFTHFRRQLLRI